MKKLAVLITALHIQACSTTDALQQKHSAAMKAHVYITDLDQYGVKDKWVPSLEGDCEDYALWMRKKVGGKLLYVKTTAGELHIVLDVDGIIIDNTSAKVYPREKMAHKLVFVMDDRQVASYLTKGATEQSKEVIYANP